MPDKLKKEILKEFDQFMLDEYGKWKIGRAEVRQFLDRTIERAREEEIIRKTKGIYFYEETDFQQGHKKYIDCLKDAEKYLKGINNMPDKLRKEISDYKRAKNRDKLEEEGYRDWLSPKGRGLVKKL